MTLEPKSGTISTPTSPVTQSEILRILQREQDHAISLLSLSPLLSSLLVSYANRATPHESASTPSPESEEWNTLRNSITALREENGRLRSENREILLKLEAAEASQGGFRSHISSLEEVNAAQRNEINSLRRGLVETKDLYERVMKDWNVEKAAYQTRISGIEVGRRLRHPRESIMLTGHSCEQVELVELKQALAEKQIKISNLERRLPNDSPPVGPVLQIPQQQARSRNSLTPSEATDTPHTWALSVGGGEQVPEMLSALIHPREVEVATHPPNLNEKARPQPLPRGPPAPPKSQPQPHQQKSSRGGWLKALNDSF